MEQDPRWESLEEGSEEGVNQPLSDILLQTSSQCDALSSLRLELEKELAKAKEHERRRAAAEDEGDKAVTLARQNLQDGDVEVMNIFCLILNRKRQALQSLPYLLTNQLHEYTSIHQSISVGQEFLQYPDVKNSCREPKQHDSVHRSHIQPLRHRYIRR